MTPAEERAARDTALAALDRLLADAPPCTVEDATKALRCVVALRDGLTAARGRGAGGDRHLCAVNAVLSLTWSGAVPIAGFRRKRLEAARAALAAVEVAEADGNRTHHP